MPRRGRRPDAAPDSPARGPVVISALREWTCSLCGGTGELLMMDDAGPLCLSCVDLDHLVFLPAGDTALTMRARKASGLSAVVIRFTRARERYERQGLLVEEEALALAEAQCLGDEEARLRRRERDRARRAEDDQHLQVATAAAIRQLFPGCPPRRAEAIARHTGLRGSGRVGRSAAGRSLAEEAIVLAVVASVRHQDTDYDRLLMAGVPRSDARERVQADIDAVLAAWRGPG